MISAKTKKIFFSLILVGLLVVPIFCSLAADDKKANDYGLGDTAAAAYGKPVGSLANNPNTIMGVIIGVVLASLGIIFLIQIIIAGIGWMTSQGNEEKVTAARNTIIHSAIGLVIVIGAYALVNFVLLNVIAAVFTS